MTTAEHSGLVTLQQSGITQNELAEIQLLKTQDTSCPENLLLQLPRYDEKGIPVFEKALELASLYAGFVLVTGEVGAGKSMTAHMLAWRLKRIFGRFGRHVLSDYPLKPAFGEHTVIDDDMLREALNNMDELSKAGGWDAIPGKTCLLHNAIWVTDELWRKAWKRRPGDNQTMVITDLARSWRHIDLLIIGMTPSSAEIDTRLFEKYVTHDVHVNKMLTRPGWSEATVWHRGLMRQMVTWYVQHEKWGKLYKSKNPLPTRKKWLTVKKEED